MTRVPNANSPVEIRKAFQQMKSAAGFLLDGTLGQILIGAGANIVPTWGTELTALTLLTVDNITIDGAVISSDTGAISFSNENLTTTGTVAGINVTSGENPGHTHTGTSLSDIDISADTNLSVTSPITLTDDDVGLDQSAIDHGSIGGRDDDDHIQYLLANGSRALAGNWSLGSNDLTSVGLFGGVDVPTANGFFNGTFQETFDATVESDGNTITMYLEQSGTGDLTMQFSDGYTTLDCTDPLQTIVLEAGASDSSPQTNYIYILQSDKILTKSTSGWPAGEHIRVAYFLVPSATFVASNGCYVNQNCNDHLTGTDLQGHMSHMTAKLRRLGATWFSGVNPNGATVSYFTIGATTTHWLSTSGEVDQLHEHTFPAVETSGSGVVLVVNQFGTAYDKITDLYSITDDNTGDTIDNNRYFSLVFWGVVNKSGEFAALMVNLPGGFYVKQSDALIDSDGYDVYDIPREFSIDSGTAFLICRATFQKGSTWTHISTTDLRGLTPATASGSSVNDHGGLGGLTDVADHLGYLLVDGSRNLAGNMSVDANITIDGRDISVDGSKLDGIESAADQTDATNVAAAGAAMSGGAFHDGFSDFVGDEHIDHSGVSISSGSGLTGGGAITGNQTLALDINGLSVVTIAAGDFVPFWDITATATNKKTTFANFEAALSHDNLIAGTIGDHSDTSGTGAELTSLTNDSMADSLHRHSELSASDGTPNPAMQISATGKVSIGAPPTYPLQFNVATSEGWWRVFNYGHVQFHNSNAGSAYWGFCSRDGGSLDIAIKTTDPAGGTITTDFTRVTITSAGHFGIGWRLLAPDARLEVETVAAEGHQAITIDQNDIDEAFIDFQGTSAADVANNISSWTGGNSIQGFVLQEINGTKRWMPFFDAPTGTSGGDIHDTTATGANLTSLTDNSMTDALHRHSELSASDGTPDAALAVDASGNVNLVDGAKSITLSAVVTNPKMSMSDGTHVIKVQTLSGTGAGYIGMDTGSHLILVTNNVSRVTIRANSGYACFGPAGAFADARFEVETLSAEGQQAVTIDQNDADQAFIDFQGTSAASAANNLSTWTNAILNGFIRMEINGAEKWIPYYNAPTS